MPELPEVEAIRLGLQKYLVGKTIDSVEVRLRKIFSGDEKDIIGAKIIDVKRFGKGLVIELDNGYSIAAHIKLTGQFVYRDSTTLSFKRSPKVGSQIPNKFTHVIIKLKNQKSNLKNEDAYLYYNDIRQFGWIKVLKTKDLKTISFFKDLGPEPPVAKAMEGQALLTSNKFREILKKSNVAIKPLIMDQKKIGGIGNIYANDGLFRARIHPERKAKDLNGKEIKNLYDSLLYVLKKGLENGGASELNYVNALGQEGKYQQHFLAYAQDGKPCSRCKRIIKKIFLGGRGTYFCEKCQK